MIREHIECHDHTLGGKMGVCQVRGRERCSDKLALELPESFKKCLSDSNSDRAKNRQ
jgi:hypothetical protein